MDVSSEVVGILEGSAENEGVNLKGRVVRDLRHINALKSDEHFRWYEEQLDHEIQGMRERLLNPRLVGDDLLPMERWRLLEWGKFRSFLKTKEEELRKLISRWNFFEEGEL